VLVDLPEDLMRIFLVVPEVCLCRYLFQLLYFSLSFIDVKDTPVTVLYDGAADAGALFLLQTYFFLFYRDSVGERQPAAPGFFSKESLFLAEIKARDFPQGHNEVKVGKKSI